jgi:hypothetical protein
MKLLELFDKQAPYEWTDFHGMPAATFEVGNTKYLVAFMPWENNFGPSSNSEIPEKFETVMGALIANYEEGDLVSGNYLLGVGNASLVFTTALHIFEEYIGRYKPEVFAVAALVAEKRPAIYARIMKRFAKEIAKTGYTLVDEETMQDTPFGAMHAFYLLRQDLT